MVARKKSDSVSNRQIIHISDKMLNLKNSRQMQSCFKNEKTLDKLPKNKLLYIVELPDISSKYIGETEKNLKWIFKRIKNMDGILLFDDADALFGKRAKIKDSHDKCVNTETSYLVKRLQKYKGVIFITTGFEKPISKQTITKLDYIICMPIKK